MEWCLIEYGEFYVFSNCDGYWCCNDGLYYCLLLWELVVKFVFWKVFGVIFVFVCWFCVLGLFDWCCWFCGVNVWFGGICVGFWFDDVFWFVFGFGSGGDYCFWFGVVLVFKVFGCFGLGILSCLEWIFIGWWVGLFVVLDCWIFVVG